MANPRGGRSSFIFWIIEILAVLQSHRVWCYQHKVGGLDCWGVPTASKPHVYTKWASSRTFKIGDTLLFLYPPSQDSVIQVTGESYSSCNIKDPILSMADGNSIFNITENGVFYFTSGKPGQCQKNQKLKIAVGVSAAAESPLNTPGSLPDTAPSYPNVFGSVPLPGSSSSAQRFSLLVSTLVGSMVGFILGRVV